MRSLIALALLGAGACTDRELGTLSTSQAATLYASITSELRNVHSQVLTTSPLPQMYSYGCPTGTIELKLGLDQMMHPVSLRHALKTCAVQELMLDGEVDYVDLDPCADDGSGTFAFTFGGLVDVEGAMAGFCYIEVRDKCGRLDGHICGFPADEVIAPQP